MTAEDYSNLIQSHWPSASSAGSGVEALSACERALVEHPNVAGLWVMRGDLIQLVESKYSLSESFQSYQRAIALDPRSAEAYEELGLLLSNVMDNPRKARQFLHKAWLLRRKRRA
jgi:Tfp pilus assembly protein PilF